MGVCQNSESNRITTILTELLPISLYQILEESSKDNTKLNLIEIINISIDIGMGNYKWTVYTCDLTEQYIRINADYRS